MLGAHLHPLVEYHCQPDHAALAGKITGMCLPQAVQCAETALQFLDTTSSALRDVVTLSIADLQTGAIRQGTCGAPLPDDRIWHPMNCDEALDGLAWAMQCIQPRHAPAGSQRLGMYAQWSRVLLREYEAAQQRSMVATEDHARNSTSVNASYLRAVLWNQVRAGMRFGITLTWLAESTDE